MLFLLWALKFVWQMAAIGMVIPYFAKGGGTHITNIVLLGFVMSVVTLFVGDLFILPRFGHVTGVIADFLLAYVVLWFGPALIDGVGAGRPYTFEGALLVAALVAASEWFVHPIVARILHMRVPGLRR
ncbi:MAG: DUF2512 family protein [Firmicutes bacterium]|nr:DUF2512 family protein [Bacillota bacterium]